MCIMCLMQSTWKVVDQTKLQSEDSALEFPYCDDMLSSVHGSASEVNHSGADVQVSPVTVILSSYIPLLSS